MSAKKTERLLNLVICLLATRRYLSVQEIRTAVPGYDQDTEEAFRRMFERDKDELRELGIPLETGTDSAAHDDEPGYRIARRDYELPEITLEPDEAAALGLAARLWQSAPLAGATGSALLKLRAAGVDSPSAPAALEPRVGASEPAFAQCLAAVRDGRSLVFTHRTAGGPPQERHVDPWGVVSWRGRWYVVGHDVDRDAPRVFRLSRIAGAVQITGEPGSVVPPPGVDLRGWVARSAEDEPRATARVSLRPGAGWELRRAATATAPDPHREGWTLVDVGFSDPGRFADRVTGYGADAVVLTPPEAREAVVARLQGLAS
ncbi:MAG: transcriptional regulator protein-like protein [Frankiales bacterium]|jgi:proteasome accessory factor B|nr:transcriptional regulator protein-like protein [Frankiales bacterium]